MALTPAQGTGAPKDDKYVTYTFKKGATVKVAKELKPTFEPRTTAEGYDQAFFGKNKENALSFEPGANHGATVVVDNESSPTSSPEPIEELQISADKANFFLDTQDGASQDVDISAKSSTVKLIRDKGIDSFTFKNNGSSTLSDETENVK